MIASTHVLVKLAKRRCGWRYEARVTISSSIFSAYVLAFRVHYWYRTKKCFYAQWKRSDNVWVKEERLTTGSTNITPVTDISYEFVTTKNRRIKNIRNQLVEFTTQSLLVAGSIVTSRNRIRPRKRSELPVIVQWFRRPKVYYTHSQVLV